MISKILSKEKELNVDYESIEEIRRQHVKSRGLDISVMESPCFEERMRLEELIRGGVIDDYVNYIGLVKKYGYDEFLEKGI